MIICHDLRLVFLHIPKCAGTALRSIFEQETVAGSSVAFFDFGYSHILRRYVDRAHLPLMDLRHLPEWRYLKRYHTVACIRHPYARLASACREFYRQHSRDTQQQMLRQVPSPEQLLAYLEALPAALEAHDLRYVHGFPITWFTHYGARPMVDTLLRVDHLSEDLAILFERHDLPEKLRAALLAVADRTSPTKPSPSLAPLRQNPNLMAIANLLHSEDFPTFQYQATDATLTDIALASRLDRCMQTRDVHAVPHTSMAPRLQWYWGRSSFIQRPPLQPTRGRRRWLTVRNADLSPR